MCRYTSMYYLWLALVFLTLMLPACNIPPPATDLKPTTHPISEQSKAAAPNDPRSYQHGIDFVPLPNGHYYLIWASSGQPPTGADADGNWLHDIYVADIDPRAPQIAGSILIKNPEAQEPASAAINSDGHIMVTMEDGWNAPNNVSQRFGVYDAALKPILAYPRLVYSGGHSGHVAAVGSQFVVFYADDWVDGGGVDNLGTGNDVKAKLYNSQGKLVKSFNVAVDESRDWWPLVAASPKRAALVWQRYVEGKTYSQLMLAVLDVPGKTLQPAIKIEDGLRYYSYNVSYLTHINRFLILGSYDKGGGFAYLIDLAGNIVASHKNLPAIVREAQAVVLPQTGKAKIVQPIAPNGLMVLSVTPSSIQLTTTVADGYNWQTSGTDGIFLDTNTVYMVNTSPSGLVAKTFGLPGGE
jgi:hypothetical protein